MRGRIRGIGVIAALALAVRLLVAGVPSAHGLCIVEEGNCDAGAATINFTVTARSTVIESVHPNVGVYFNNVLVFTGAFVQATGNQFSGSLPAPSGALVDVSARANGPWT